MKYIIHWNQGTEFEVIEADSEEEAEKAAYEAWREYVESQSDYGVEEYSEEALEELQ